MIGLSRLGPLVRAACVTPVFVVASAGALDAQDCSSLINDFDNFRNAVEDELDAVWSSRLADVPLWGNRLSQETLAEGMALIHRWEQTRENVFRNALRLGPQAMDYEDRVEGDLRVAGVAGDRMWIMPPAVLERNVRVRVRKLGGRAQTHVVVCRWDPDGVPTRVARDIVRGNHGPGVKIDVRINDLEPTEFVTVFLDNRSAVNQFEYRVVTNTLAERDVVTASEAQQQSGQQAAAPQGPSVTVTSDSNLGDVTWGPWFWMDIFPSDSDGSGTPLATTTVDVASWSGGYEQLFVGRAEPAVTWMYRPFVERTANRIRANTGNSAGTLNLNLQGNQWLGTLRGADGNTYRVKLRPRPAP